MEESGGHRVAVVTGAGRGAGRVVAERLSSDWFRVAVGDVDERSAEDTAATIGEGAVGFGVDVSSSTSAQGFIAAVVGEMGRLDVLVNMMRHTADEFAAQTDDRGDDVYRHLVDVVPMGRATRPTDIANALPWLVRDEAEFITGESLNVTRGGWMSSSSALRRPFISRPPSRAGRPSFYLKVCTLLSNFWGSEASWL